MDRLNSQPRHISDISLTVEFPSPEFRLPTSCQLDVELVDAGLLDFLARKVAARPRDLVNHVRRILLARQNDAEATFAALFDLFVAAGASGLSLRQRLLNRCIPILDSKSVILLQSGLANGLSANIAWPCAESMLASGTISHRKAVTRMGNS
jgi:hypothetical protein